MQAGVDAVRAPVVPFAAHSRLNIFCSVVLLAVF